MFNFGKKRFMRKLKKEFLLLTTRGYEINFTMSDINDDEFVLVTHIPTDTNIVPIMQFNYEKKKISVMVQVNGIIEDPIYIAKASYSTPRDIITLVKSFLVPQMLGGLLIKYNALTTEKIKANSVLHEVNHLHNKILAEESKYQAIEIFYEELKFDNKFAMNESEFIEVCLEYLMLTNYLSEIIFGEHAVFIMGDNIPLFTSIENTTSIEVNTVTNEIELHAGVKTRYIPRETKYTLEDIHALLDVVEN